MSNEKTTVHNMPSSIVDAQLQRLLEIVDEFKKQQCKELLEQAHEQSRQVTSHSYRNARTRLHSHILEDRQQLDQSLASVRARQHTFVMQQKHQASRTFLDDSWELLTSKLIARWENPEQRQAWVRAIADIAIASLQVTEWHISCGSDLSKAENKQLREYLTTKSDRKVTIEAVPDIRAGIRIEADGAVVDGSLQGLLSDRVRIESEILAQCTNCIVHSRVTEGQQEKV